MCLFEWRVGGGAGYTLTGCAKPLSANLLNSDSVVPMLDDLLECSQGL